MPPACVVWPSRNDASRYCCTSPRSQNASRRTWNRGLTSANTFRRATFPEPVRSASPVRLALPLASIRVAVRMLFVPRPRSGDNIVELREIRLPTQLTNRLFGGRHQPRRVARPARVFNRGDFFFGDFFSDRK